jgi:hypothetical protein
VHEGERKAERRGERQMGGGGVHTTKEDLKKRERGREREREDCKMHAASAFCLLSFRGSCSDIYSFFHTADWKLSSSIQIEKGKRGGMERYRDWKVRFSQSTPLLIKRERERERESSFSNSNRSRSHCMTKRCPAQIAFLFEDNLTGEKRKREELQFEFPLIGT